MSIHTLAEQYWTYLLSIAPSWATLLGIHDHDAELEDLSRDAEDDQRARLARFVDDVEQREPEGHSERVTHSMLRAELDGRLRALGGAIGHGPSHVVMSCNQMGGPHLLLLQATASMTFPEPAHATAAVQRFGQADRYLAQAVDRFREGLELALPPVTRNLRHVLGQVDGYLASPLDTDPLLTMAGPANWDGTQAWRDDLRAVASNVIRPAMQRYRDAIEAELVPHGRDDERAGLCWLDGGDAIYRDKARISTSTDIDPDDVHAVGRDYIDGPLAAEFSALGERLFATTDMTEIFMRMRNDDDLRYQSGEQMITDAEEALTRARAETTDWFGRLPVADCEVKPVPEFLASSAPPAYYIQPATDGSRGGTYFLNTRHASAMFRFEGQATAFHEAIPGHHLQLAIASELDGVPAFQQHSLQTAYAEGWGLYAERLANEMGLYSQERDLLGMLALDAFRAARLVVDTGLHAKGWSRERAVEYMRDHTPLPFETIDAEVDRYIAIPGQALAYKLGQLEIRRLREHAETTLGDAFDIAGFHDTVLGSGMVTLGVLGDLVDDWMSAQADRSDTADV
ncbi:MAG: DUF885 domain-containing protein [Actinobacteria bacterium]|nr:DUF885 domain-containing protein [Actinomycetota bacterium]